MRKSPKIKITLVVFAILIGIAILGFFIVFPAWNYFASRDKREDANAPKLAEEAENIDFNEENGLLYVNDEIIIMTYEGVTRNEVEALADEFRARIVTAMEDIGFWQLGFQEAMTYEDLNRVLRKIKKSELVEDAYFNTVYENEPDEADEATKVVAQIYPNDPWDGDANTWNIEVPRGSNWGMEAIKAPLAWGYLEEMSDINIGLIDTMVDIGHEDIDLVASYVTLTEDTSTTYDASNWTPGDHGTHVSGTIAGSFNNGSGVSGVMGDKGKLYYSAAYTLKKGKLVEEYYTAFNYLAALKALIDQEVKVINISQNTSRLIGFAASRGNKNAINHLQNAAEISGKGLKRIIDQGKEFVICVAAGNSNSTTYYKSKIASYGYKENWFWPWDYYKRDSGDSEAIYNNFLNLIDEEEVKNRIIVVGSIGIDSTKSNTKESRYRYSPFSCIGSRVDVVAPGEDIYSSTVGTYAYLSGTSMATPHVSGVAGLVFACNPELSGADVKRIVLASTTGRFYYTDGYSGLIDAEIAVKNALLTREQSVNRVIKSDVNDGLDLCFVVDTTGSMGDDIENAKENMSLILEELTAKNENFRVALIDYRDFADRAESYDYPSKLQLDFSQDKDAIISAINALDLGNGGDDNETVYSGLMEAAGLKWRPQAEKAIIVLGDAPPLDPEPYTDYTLEQVTAALYNADISLLSDTSVGVDAPSYGAFMGDASDSVIKVFSIGTDPSDAAVEFFREISEVTGGHYTGVEDASEVSSAIISTIEQIEITPTATVTAAFGEEYTGETVELYKDGEFIFEITLDEEGDQKLENMKLDRYQWSIPRLKAAGALRIKEGSKKANIIYDDLPWYAFAISLWHRERMKVISYGALGVIILIIVVIILHKLRRRRSNRSKEFIHDNSVSENGQKNELITEQIGYQCKNCGTTYHYPVSFCGECGTRMDFSA